MQPMTTSSTSSAATPARSRAAFTAVAPSSTPGTSLKAPPKLPIGVRAPSSTTIRSLFMCCSSMVDAVHDAGQVGAGRAEVVGGVRVPGLPEGDAAHDDPVLGQVEEVADVGAV